MPSGLLKVCLIGCRLRSHSDFSSLFIKFQQARVDVLIVTSRILHAADCQYWDTVKPRYHEHRSIRRDSDPAFAGSSNRLRWTRHACTDEEPQ